MQDWWTTVDWLRGKINPPGLTLRLAVADTGPGAPPSYYGTITVHEGDAIMKAYMDLLQPLVPLANDDGLARFYAHLAYPWELTAETKSATGMTWFGCGGKRWLLRNVPNVMLWAAGIKAFTQTIGRSRSSAIGTRCTTRTSTRLQFRTERLSSNIMILVMVNPSRTLELTVFK